MNFRVGPYVYRVRQVQGLIAHEGQDCLGLCDNDKHELLVSDQVSLAQQVQVVCHEYIEAWIYHFGQNLRDKEDYCDLFGLAMTQFVFDFIQSFHTQAASQTPEALSYKQLVSPLQVEGNSGVAGPPPTHTPKPSTGAYTPRPAIAAKAGRQTAASPDSKQHGGAKRWRVRRVYEPSLDDREKGWLLRIFEPVSENHPTSVA